STRYGRPPRGPAGSRATRRAHPPWREPAEEVALVAHARRELLLHAHRHRLRPEDLEDCYSQATLELVARALKGPRSASLYRSGVRPIQEILRDNPLAQDYVHWGAPGPGRWVTIYSTTEPAPHV